MERGCLKQHKERTRDANNSQPLEGKKREKEKKKKKGRKRRKGLKNRRKKASSFLLSFY